MMKRSLALSRTTAARRGMRFVLGLAVPAAVLGLVSPVQAQFAGVGNAGGAAANTGANQCIGNASTNNLGGPQFTQGGLIGLGLTLGGPVNYSDGSCNITTGDAAAAGNTSQTEIAQGGGGFPFHFQPAAGVSNTGMAAANTGGNECVGNSSANNLGGQQVTQGGLIGLGLTLGGPVNYSNGSCEITTGNAAAAGNTSQTGIGQGGGGGGGFPFVFAPAAAVTNNGQAAANTGGNGCVGNNSVNNLGGQQVTQGGLIGLGLTLGGPVNYSNGSCQITTGNAAATGNVAQTQVYQGGTGNGFHGFPFFFAPFAEVTNFGTGEANTGNNFAVGNVSQNNAATSQFAAGSLLGVGIIAGGPTNFSDGSAVIDTGNAAATGNSSGTQVQQSYQYQW